MTDLPTWAVVITSAAVGSLAGSLMTLFGQALERRARRRELLFTKALDLAKVKNDRLQAIAATAKRGRWQMENEVYLARLWHADLESLFDGGRLTESGEKTLKELTGGDD